MTPTQRSGDDGMERRVGNLEVQVATILTTLKTHAEWVGESREFHKEMDKFKTDLLARQDAIRDEQNRKHKANSWKLSVIMCCIALGTLIVAIVSLYVSSWVHSHAQADPIKIMKSQDTEPQEARLKQYLANEE